jgi:GNAT superfamily N-acetyltransferase
MPGNTTRSVRNKTGSRVVDIKFAFQKGRSEVERHRLKAFGERFLPRDVPPQRTAARFSADRQNGAHDGFGARHFGTARERGQLRGLANDLRQARCWRWMSMPALQAGFRKRGVGRALAQAAVNFAQERGARAIEGYPITTKDVILQELHVGTEHMFAEAGFREVSRPTARRLVMRVDF